MALRAIHRSAAPRWDPYEWVGRAALLLMATLAAFGASLQAQSPSQILRGLVADSITGLPLADVLISHESDAGIRTTTSDWRGQFTIQLDGVPPFDLSLERLGYHYVKLQTDGAAGVLSTVQMSEIAFELDGVGTEGTAEEERFKVFGHFWSSHAGLTSPLDPGYCFFLARDSVVVKDPKLLLPEVTRSYERANLWVGDDDRYRRITVAQRREHIFDPRMRHDAWPCGIYYLRGHQVIERTLALPRPPLPTGAPIALQSTRAIPIPTASLCPEAISVSATNRVSFVTRDASLVNVVDTEASESYSLDPGVVEGAYPCPVRVGWRGDSLWITNGSTGQLSVIDGENRVSAMAGQGVPARMDWALPEHPLPSRPLAMDIPVPVPVSGNRWLWSWPAMDPPNPPIHPDDPPGRQLVLLDEEWELDHVLRELRPGAGAVDLVLGDEPLIAEQPFGDHPLVQVSPEGRTLTVVQREHQLASWLTVYRVTRINFEGDTLFHTERRAHYVRVDDDDHEAMVERLASAPGAMAAIPGESAGRETLIDQILYRAPFHPSISAVMVGHDGTVWLRWPEHEQDEMVQWEVLDTTGAPLYNFEADPALELISAKGDTVWGILPNENGVRQLVRFSLVVG